MKSRNLLPFLATAKAYRQKPSELLALDDPYTAYCLDEACLYIEARRSGGEAPVYQKTVRSFHEFYNSIQTS